MQISAATPAQAEPKEDGTPSANEGANVVNEAVSAAIGSNAFAKDELKEDGTASANEHASVAKKSVSVAIGSNASAKAELKETAHPRRRNL